MKKILLFVIYLGLISCLSITARAASVNPPVFINGDTQSVSLCENGSLYFINFLFQVTDADAGDQIIWSALTTPLHGTLALSDTMTSTGGMLSPSGLTYSPATGYVGTDSFKAVVTDGTFSDTTTIYVTVNPLPHAGTISGPTSLCVGQSAVYSSAGSSFTSSFWSSSNTNATNAHDTFTAVSAGIDSVVFVAVNSCGGDVSFHVITINTTPAVGPISGASALCMGTTETLSAPFTGGTWVASNTNATLSGSTLTGAAAGMDTILHIGTNSCGTDTAMFIVTIDTTLTTAGSISGADSVCAGAAISLTNTVAGGIWSHNNTMGSISSTGVLAAATTAMGLDTVVYTAMNSCGSISTSKIITINPLPDAGTITGYDSVCAGSSISLTATIPGGVWTSTIPDFANVSATGVVTGSLNGGVTIHYTVTNSCGSAVASHPVRINIPAQPIAGASTVCQFSFTILTDAVAGGTWASDNFLTAPVLGGNVVGLMLGNATITYTVNNACGTSSETFDIEVIDCSAGVDNVANKQEVLSLMPNPSNGAVTIILPGMANETATVVVTNMLGATVKEFTMPANTATEMNLDIPAGVYTVSASVKNTHYTARMVVTN